MDTQENINNEKWRPVEGYDGLYELRSDGLLHSFPRKYCEGGYSYGYKVGKGYLKHSLSKNGVVTNKRVNRLVWETFVGPIPKGYDIHHKNHNRQDNRLENLELIEKDCHKDLHSSKVVQYTLDGEFIAEYQSIAEAARKTGIKQSNISHCCIGTYGFKTAGGFIWKYK